MKKLGFLISFVFFLASGNAWASVVDAPHNETNGVKCSNCHSYSLWWQYSPANLSANPDHATIVDAVCMTCHGPTGTEPQALTHSSAAMGASNHGNWGVGCVACHNPHYQDQLNWAGSATEPYLVTGDIDSVSYNDVLDQTVVSYSNATFNGNWPAEGAAASDLDWGNKSLANPDRGLVLVHDKTATSNTFLIVSATNSQVVVKGRLDSNAVDPNYTDPETLVVSSATANTFGLIYGQLVRDSIASKAVKFFDPNGGFVEAGAGTTGVCQVCHTLVTHFANTGDFPGITDSHAGRESTNCTVCHAHDGGFKGGGTHDNTAFGWAGNCATCHNANGQVENIVSGLHGSSCGICHVSAGGGGPRKDGNPLYGIDASAIGATNNSTCADCHITKLGLNSNDIHHVSKNGYAAAGDCVQCHQSGTGTLAADHSARVNEDSACVGCHASTAGSAAGIAVNAQDSKIHDACTTCHNTNGTLKTAYGKASAMPPGGGNCTACHGVYFPTHTHSHTLNKVAICLNCHVAAEAPFASAGEVHKNGCQTCHNAITGALSGVASGKTAGADCQTCHTGYFNGHGHSHTMATVSLCVSCHATATSAPYVLAGQTHSRLACQTCHSNATGVLVGSATGMKGVSGITCQTCHSTYFSGHSKDHSLLVKKNSDTTVQLTHCTGCHWANTAPFVDFSEGEVHSVSGCVTCHSPVDGSLQGSAAPRGVNSDVGGECADCHSAYLGGHSVTHTVAEQGTDLAQADPGSSCVTCHSISTWPAILNLHSGLCSTCHNAGRTTGNPNNAGEKVSDVIAAKADPTPCLACHWSKKTPATHGHDIDWTPANELTCGAPSCHDSTQNTAVVSMIHGNNCLLCHVDPPNNDYTRRAGTNGSAIGQVLGITASCTDCHTLSTPVLHHGTDIALTGHCTTCHTGDFAPDHIALVGAEANCSSASCHAGTEGIVTGVPTSALDNKIHDECLTCHETSGGLKAAYGKAVAMPDGGAGSNNGGGTCSACHGAYFANHANPNHATRVITSANCNLCHLTASIAGTPTGIPVDPDNHKVHDQCFTCHNANGSLQAAYGKASAIPAGGGVCEVCHGAYFASHSNADHSTKVGDTANCNTCHTGTAGTATEAPVSAADNKIHDTCSVCHNSNGSLRAQYSSKAPAMPSGGGTCNDCHGTYFVNHANADHTARVAPSASCASCHTATAGNSTSVPVNASDAKIHDACVACHDTTTGALKAPYGKAPNMASPGGDCVACHGAYLPNHSHAHSLPPVALCLNCHTATSAPYAAAGQVHETNGCQTCHSNATGLLTGVAAGKTSGATCTICHSGYFTGHSHTHAMSTAPLCVSCHTTATTAPYVAAGQTHARLGCLTCHSATTGLRTGSAMGKATGETCQTCHSTYFNGHSHNHATKMTANLASTPNTSNCKGCHSASTAPFVAAGQVHNPLGCGTCHDVASNGALKGSAFGKTGNKECVTCHSTYFAGHQQHSSSTHDVLMRGGDLSGGVACNACHTRGGLNSGNPLFSNSWSGAEGILGLHHNDCALCHNSTRATNVGVGFTSINDVIKTGVAVGCLNCHANRAIEHGGHNEGDGTFIWVSACQSCHGQGSSSQVAPRGEIMADVHGDTCGKCHQGGIPGATLIGPAANATWGVKPHTCTECHASGFMGHQHALNHDVAMTVDDKSGTGQDAPQCNACHKRGGVGSANPLFTTTWDGTDGILALHNGSCTLCHNSTRTTNIGGGFSSVSNVIMAHTVTVHCLDCHADRAASHASHNVTDFTWDGNCNTCHTGANIAANVHKSQCGLCHVNPNGGGTKRGGSDGSALLAEALGDPRTAGCLTCHPVTTYPTGSIHHNTRTAATNDCQTCHKAIDHTTFVVAVSPCLTCHATTAGTATGLPIDMKNSRTHDACRTCHTFNAITLAGELAAPSGKRGVTAMAPGTCITCHTSATTMHHANGHALIGECEYCHADPRNRAGGANFQETLTGAIPTHLPCDECHIMPKLGTQANGWTATAGQMTIYAYNEGGTHSTSDYSSNFTRTVANGGGHVIGNTVGQINNWGICFSCHDGSGDVGKAVRVNVFHAKPSWTARLDRSGGGASGKARYAPGREVRNTIGNFDFFASTFRPSSTKPMGPGSPKARTDWTSSVKYGSTIFAASDQLIPDPWSAATVAVPMFPGQAKKTMVSPSADNVKVTSAIWNGTNLVVTVKNTDGCAVLTAVYNGNNQGFTGTGICTATFSQAVVYTDTVPTLNVTTSNPQGLNVSGYRVSDTTVTHTGHMEGDGTFNWEPTCQECHGVGSWSEAAPKGDIIEGIHMGDCGHCHQGGVGGNPLIGAATHVAALAKPFTCTQCHDGYFDNHSHSINHDVSIRAIDKAAGEFGGQNACNTCHRRGGTSSANPLLTNTWAGADGILALHQGGCAECHQSKRATKVAQGYTSIANVILTGTDVGCLDCHATRSAYHAKHVEGDGMFAVPELCQSCHGAASTSTEAPHGEVIANIHQDNCGLCHESGIGGANLIGSATNADMMSRPHYCTDCHSAYFPAHQRGANHDVLMRASDKSVSSPCNFCHKVGGVGSTGPLFTNTWAGSTGILALHQEGCAQCHQSTRDINVSAGYTSVLDVIMRATSVSCQNCHDNRVASHGRHVEDDGRFEFNAVCESCHGPGSLSDHAPFGEIIADVHSDNCIYCHEGGIGGGAFIGSAANVTYRATPHLCTECHIGYFDAHKRGPNHDVSMIAEDLSNGNPCNTCHRRGGTDVTDNPLFVNQWTGADGILGLHQGGCLECHASTRTKNLEAGYASIKSLIMLKDAEFTTANCLECHADRAVAHGNHKPTDFAWDGDCNRCHSGDNVVVSVHKANCGLCHVDMYGAGTRKAGANGSALLGDAFGLKRAATCLTCHPTATYPKDFMHHKSPAAATNNCTLCHAGASHATLVNATGTTCISCHTATAGNETGIPVSTGEGKVHDRCRTCHTFDVNFKGVLVAATNQKGVTAMPAGGAGTNDGGGLCTACHTAALGNLHHGTGYSLSGACEYCHADPRNLAGGTNFQYSAPAGGIPTHLPCEECHVKPKRGATVNGWTATAGQVTIYAYNEGGTHSTTDYSSDFSRTVAHSGGHVIGNTAGQINNWGICFSCHDGTGGTGKAVRVDVFHAKPTMARATRPYGGSSGKARYAPGREVRNTMGNFDFFASTFRPTSTKPSGSGSPKATSDWSASVKYGSTLFPATDVTVPDPWNAGSPIAVPVFPAQAAVIPPTSASDNIQVTSAIWDGFNIKVEATTTNPSGCATLTAVYNGQSQVFSSTGTCIATFAGSVVYTNTVPTLNVTTSNVQGFNVTGYRITDGTLTLGSHAEDDGTFTWVASCQTCHGGLSASTAAPHGEVIAEVHHGDCALCHQSGVAAATLIGSAANAVRGVKPHPCTECHLGYFGNHFHGTGAAHDVAMRSTDKAGSIACNNCHRRGGTLMTSNPLFTNAFAGTNGILALHQQGCGQCHDSTRTTNVAAPYTSVKNVIMTGTSVGCLDCHAKRGTYHAAHLPTDFGWEGICNTCHSGADIVTNLHQNKCGLCHVNPAGGGARKSAAKGNALLSDTSGMYRSSTCLTCHDVTTYPAGGIHHDTPQAVTNNCTTCHPAVDHSVRVDGTGTTCIGCHFATAGTGTGMSTSTNDSRIHDACRSCHAFDAQLKGVLVAPTNNKGVGAMPAIGGLCTDCHTSSGATIHHANNHAKLGECEYCHADPRNLEGVANSFQFGAPNGVPTHLPCEECHVKPKNGATVNGWTATAGQMTIYAYNEGGSHSTTDYSSDFTRTVAHNGGHVIGNTVGQINNWGICFSCHDGSGAPGKAVRVNLFHAKPTMSRGTRPYGGSNGTARYAPGREVRNTMGNFDFFASTFRPTSTKPSGSGSPKAASDWTSSVKYGSTLYTTTELGVPDPWNNGAIVTVPVFPEQTMNTTSSPAADDVKVLSVTWNGANIVVTATNTDGCAALTAVYNGNNQTFTGVDTCTATFGSGVIYSSSLPTLSVTTTNPEGLGVAGYPIEDKSTPIPANAVNDLLGAASVGVTNLDVLANDAGTGRVIVAVSQPLLGEVAIAGGGESLDYTGAGVGTTTFSYTVRASDNSTNTATVILTIQDSAPPAFNPTTFSRGNAELNDGYTGQTIAGAAIDPEGDPIHYSKVSGPAWLTVAKDGTLGGIPTVAGEDSFVVRATAIGGSADATLAITVNAPMLVTYNMQSSSANLNGLVANYRTCGTNITGPAVTSMNITSGSNQCTSGRVATIAAGPVTLLTVVSETPYAVSKFVTGVDVVGNLRDYQEGGNPGTTAGIRYNLGYVKGGTFTSFGSVTEVRDYSTQADWTTDLSSISGTAPAGSSLAVRVTKLNTGSTQYRYYFTSTSFVLRVMQ